MRFLNLELPVRNRPSLDPAYVPLGAFVRAHQQAAAQPFAVALERGGGQVSVFETRICATAELAAADAYYLDRLVKFLLWSRGGWRVTLCGDEDLGKAIRAAYAPDGSRAFDRDFMERVYERPFEVALTTYEDRPAHRETARKLGGHLDGCRIGFDAGGSDRKVSAVQDGVCVYAEEVVWHPKQNADPDYHYGGIVSALKTAASKLPRVDAVGVSSAGVFVDDRCMVASLFLKVPPLEFDRKVKDIYLRAVREIGADIPVAVCNDGDVTALAGSMGADENGILGIAMGTSEAVGYVDQTGCITGWLNELAFAPVDCNPRAMMDEWSGDIGCGVKYFSQDGVCRLAGLAGLALAGQTPAEQLKSAQALMAAGNEKARQIFSDIGVCLGHTLALYSEFYEIRRVLVLGRVLSGAGGDLILQEANRVLREEYPALSFLAETPDENTRRVGQSVAAASLPRISRR